MIIKYNFYSNGYLKFTTLHYFFFLSNEFVLNQMYKLLIKKTINFNVFIKTPQLRSIKFMLYYLFAFNLKVFIE